MRWPWTSVARLDDLELRLADMREDRDYLRERNKELTESITRLQRFQTGMTEVPRPPRKEIEPMTDPLKEYIEGIATPSMRRDIRGRLLKRHAKGEPWASIEKEILKPPEGSV